MTNEAQEFADQDVRITFDESLVGRPVEADGGAPIAGGQAGYRTTFTGRLTGRRLAQGDPAWLWLELGDLVEAPRDFEHAHVWVDEAYVYFLDEKRS